MNNNMVYVTSAENPVYRDCLRLQKKKYRDREGACLIEGENLIREALENEVRIESLIIREDSRFTKGVPRIAGVRKIYVMNENLFRSAADTETSQGILAVIRKPEWTEEEIRGALSEGRNLVILDRLQDPGNIGTILRTAEGAGYGAALIVKGTADIWSPKVLRAAAGAVFRLPLVYADSPEAAADLTRRLGKRLLVTSVTGGVRYFDADLSRDAALVIGNEGNGVDDVFFGRADQKVFIPMGGRLESLNAAVAAGILMYETVRANGRTGNARS